MAGYIGAKQGVTQVDGYNRSEADAEFVQTAGDTMTGALAVNGNLTVDTNTLFVDAANNRVGVGTTSVSGILSVDGSMYAGPGSVSGVAYGFYPSSTYGNTGMFSPAANTVAFATSGGERARINASGNVGIGTTDPSLFNGVGGTARLVVTGSDATTTVANNSGAALVIANTDDTANNLAGLHFAWQDTDNSPNYAGASIVSILGTKVAGQYPAGQLAFLTSSTTNSAPSEKVRIASNGYVGFDVTSPTSRIHLNGGTPSVSNSGIAAAWNVHSDYRLKENVVEFSGASSLVSQLRPVKFSWVGEDQSEATTAGFIAHEMAEVAPYSVIGEKDAVNEDGSIKSQAADYSKLVPLLTAALQEALTEIQDLKARVATLEGGAA
jgi:hypothetical protein